MDRTTRVPWRRGGALPGGGALAKAAFAKAAFAAICVAAMLSLHPGAARAATPVTVAVADFDYVDTSGEPADQSAKHAKLVATFAELLRDDLGSSGDYRVLAVKCDRRPCTATSMPVDEFVAAARKSGARFVAYGGIRKMSTLVQWGDVELFDLENNKLLLRRTVSFRGDNDTAFRRAARFVGDTLKDAMPRQ
ncbi:MAG: DUF2380 domain-containing protein [Bradyrhizobium sp.]|uniref:DUF2380 domain-containing protein n=1 Tax=Bradyrhizobium sp. TaxID=376 RepID=UPI0025BA963E|nr:DUF2380 domain-containing protein [Bradyrhizobium sp.]MBI5265481.1 DUF2380 domain-containing protein [Bradyrhizobium sp.]